MKHFITLADKSSQELNHIFDVAFALREQRRGGEPNKPVLAGMTLAMIFEKPSLRTRVSFEQGIVELGGHAMVLSDAEVGIGRRESAADVVRVIEGMVHGVIARVYEHQKLLDMVQYGSIPVINALSDDSHPVQALADGMTIMDEFGRDLSGRTLAFIGEGFNVAHSLLNLCAKLNMRFVLACPPGFEFSDEMLSTLPDVDCQTVHDPAAAVHDADVVYTDTWTSMGQEQEKENRVMIFRDYQVNAKLLEAAPSHAIVLHCLPAYRGYEITEDVFDGAQSRIINQAHNRLHSQKGLLAVLYEGG